MPDDDFSFNSVSTKEKEEETEKERPSLNEQDIEILFYMEQFYWKNGRLPSVEVVSQTLKIEPPEIRKTWLKDGFQESLVRMGVLSHVDKKDGVLTPKQAMLVNMLMNVEDKQSVRQKLAALDITSTQYNAWLRDPVFQEYLKLRTEQLFQFSDHEAYKSLLQAVTNQDVSAIKLFFEMRGIYNPRVQIDINIETVIYRVVEIVAKHIKDPIAIEAIARDIESLNLPKNNNAIAQIA
jgi:hypothetical protein